MDTDRQTDVGVLGSPQASRKWMAPLNCCVLSHAHLIFGRPQPWWQGLGSKDVVP